MAVKSNNENNNRSLLELAKAQGFVFSKSKGQNFLVDSNIPEKIVRLSGVDKSYGVLEIGPGLGALTSVLSTAAGHVTAVEIDNQLIPVLKERYAGCKNVNITHGDILKLDIKELLNETMNGLNYHVCANLPYNITTPAISKILDLHLFKSVTIMIQKEVAMRICAKPGTSEYGAFTVYANYHTEPKILFDVPPECFMPRPKVTSSVVLMSVREKRLLDIDIEKRLFSVVKAAFGQRRKTLVNALHSVFGRLFDKNELTGLVEKCGFDTLVRGEALSLEDFITFSVIFHEIATLREQEQVGSVL